MSEISEFEKAFGEKCDLTVAQQLRVFAKLVGLERMHPTQQSEMSKAFYAGFNQAFMLFTNEISAQSDDDGMKTLENLADELNQFMDDQIKAHEKNKEEDENTKSV